MTKELSWAGFILLLLSLGLAGCSKVEKCKRGAEGCLGGRANAAGECAAGLVAVGGVCVEPSGEQGLPSYCDDAEQVPQTVSVPPSCEATNGDEELAFDEICRRKCVQECRRAEVFCTAFECDRDCSGAAVRTACLVECAGDTECLTASCLAVARASCSTFECPVGSARNCGDVQCSNTCSGNTEDTFCDDGDPASALYSLCAFGTDCTDCGPRVGSRPPRAPIQGLCPAGRDVACEGYNDDYTRNEAFCVHVEGAQEGQFSCVPDCTDEDEECPDGFECQALIYSNGDPYTDLDMVQGFACFPTFCG